MRLFRVELHHRYMHPKKLIFGLSAACLTLCALSSARAAVGDLWRSQGKLNALVWLMPNDARARLERSAPGDLELAAALAPTRSQALIELALAAEARGDSSAARRHLDEALRRDVTFRPRWALINFLMRRGEVPAVLSYSAAAAAIYEGDLTALFDLCLRTGAPLDRIYRGIVPIRPKAQREYLQLLMRRSRQIDAMAAALRLADLAHPGDREMLFDLCDQLLSAGEGAKAAQLWKAVPRFTSGAGRCLDWKQQQVDGITIIETGESVVRLDLSGRQPQSAAVARRIMVVQPGHGYRLRATVAGEDTVTKALEWRWNGVAVGKGRDSGIEVEAVRQICELELVIRRLPGDRAAEGLLEITNIELTPKAGTLASAGSYAGRRAVWRPTSFQELPSLTHIIMK